MTDPICIPVYVSDGNFRWHCHAEITPEIQAQILAPLEKRIAALEASNSCRLGEILDCQERTHALENAVRVHCASYDEFMAKGVTQRLAFLESQLRTQGNKEPFLGDAHQSEIERAHTAHNCGICGEYVTEGQYHDCKPVPGKMLDAMRAERDAARAEAERQKGRADAWCAEVVRLANDLGLWSAGDPVTEADPKVWREIVHAAKDQRAAYEKLDAARAEANALRLLLREARGDAVSLLNYGLTARIDAALEGKP